ncbi:uncharacterized protein N7496_008628 [Penicillium cataractarum]|uniref:Phytocyanin domain-containing protein n=1 Tax=Penicillium cataractarum TaxID=2100454 RepID=A0A9W9RYS3_9EURO|nr:uncharacterized protein N7496_008628 [Penicillium cataractarum]KAJ5368868.1 hypothetical protein N7496_008628 [Penicillium cataractarum]
MNLLSTIALFSSLPLIHAQYGNQAKSSATTAASSTTSTTSAASGIHTVDVGEDGLTFNPDSLTVSPGDKVEFHFYPPDHSVVQASFDNPCQPISSGGFFSGFFQTSQESKTVFTVTVNNTDPIWLYCGVQGHCQAGMVGVINPPSSGDTLDLFKAAAAKAKDSTVPANVFGGVVGTASSENTSSTATGTATATSTGSASKTSASTSTTTNAANTMRTAGDVGALALLGLFSWLMM